VDDDDRQAYRRLGRCDGDDQHAMTAACPFSGGTNAPEGQEWSG